DPINRRGGIRLDGTGEPRLYQSGPIHYFAMLPCGEVWFHGAPATLRDIPLGTHVQGYFYLPPEGEEDLIPAPPDDFADMIPKHNHAVLLQDDITFYKSRGQSWKVLSLDFETNKMEVESVGNEAKDGLTGKQTFDFDVGTRVWKERRAVEMTDVELGTVVQLNFGWAAGWQDKELGLNDIWLDGESQEQARQLQDKRNVRYHRIRWLPGRIETVEEFDFGGGLVTISLFGGVSKQIHDELFQAKDERVAVAAAEPTLRTWRHRSDRKFGKIVEWETLENPRPGDSGIRLHMKFPELIDHYRPGNSVRVKSELWLFVSVPPEERIKDFDDREDAKTFRLP
ncbi:MAG: hypothetical protein AAF585_25915, partial [Verrucomicrobiota bacterium]